MTRLSNKTKVDNLFKPSTEGYSRKVLVKEIVNSGLKWSKNGNGRRGIYFGDHRYNWKVERGSGRTVISLQLNGLNESIAFNQTIRKDIKDEFTFRDTDSFKNNILYKDIKNSNSVCICVRQNRFSEKKRILTKDDNEKSLIFINEQINYIKKAIDMIKSKVTDPKFFLWSNGNIKLSNYFPNNEYTFVSTNKIGLDLFLMTQAKHFIVIPSSYNWWGAWLNKNENGIILRPSHDHFSNFSLNNENFWPSSWSIV